MSWLWEKKSWTWHSIFITGFFRFYKSWDLAYLADRHPKLYAPIQDQSQPKNVKLQLQGQCKWDCSTKWTCKVGLTAAGAAGWLPPCPPHSSPHPGIFTHQPSWEVEGRMYTCGTSSYCIRAPPCFIQGMKNDLLIYSSHWRSSNTWNPYMAIFKRFLGRFERVGEGGRVTIVFTWNLDVG